MEGILIFTAMTALLCAAGSTASDGGLDKANLMFYAGDDGAVCPVKSVPDWERRRANILGRMQEVMGPLPDASNKVPLDLRIIEEYDGQGYTRKKITFAVEAWDRLPAYLLIPKNPAEAGTPNSKGKRPALLCLHPTYAHGKDIVVGISGQPNRNYAEELAQRGYVTLAPDYTGFGDYVASRKALYAHGYVSATMKGIWNHMRCVDLLAGLPEVDSTRIGCIGHSLGGHNTLFVGVFDPRIEVMVTSCGFNAFPKYMNGDLTGWSHDGYMPRIAEVYGKDPARMPFDFPEVLGALAPRPVFINAPLHDANFEVTGVRDCIQAAEPVYRLYEVSDRLVVEYPEAEHDFPPEVRAEAYAFIDKAFGSLALP